jgi:TfoX/Sxy family transcriptional regulator of competence genes
VASTRAFVDHVVDQIHSEQPVTSRAMFGEYGLFAGTKLVGLICDDRLFVKPTEGGRAFIGNTADASPYPGAKPCFLIEDQLDDAEWLSRLIRITAEELPERGSKKKRKR